ncbi:hypothetical protein Ddc_20158 [Ditylenchus destructor]|nr:hypothetical protein Ddc_20158 [Ditylenchus destructor]
MMPSSCNWAGLIGDGVVTSASIRASRRCGERTSTLSCDSAVSMHESNIMPTLAIAFQVVQRVIKAPANLESGI